MTRRPEPLTPLLHFLTGDLDELGKAAPETIRSISTKSGFDRAPLARRIRDSVISKYRIDRRAAGLRNELTVYGIDTLNELAGSDLSHLRLAGADFQGANLQSVDLRHSDLSRANLQYADFRNACLAEAKLVGATLSYTQLDQVDFTGADLSQAIIVGASFGGAVIDGAKGLPDSIQNAVKVSLAVKDVLVQIRTGSPAASEADRAGLDRAIEQILIGDWTQAEATLDAILVAASPSSDQAQQAHLVWAVLSALQADLKAAKSHLADLE